MVEKKNIDMRKNEKYGVIRAWEKISQLLSGIQKKMLIEEIMTERIYHEKKGNIRGMKTNKR